MRTFLNDIIINGERYTHTVEAATYKEAVEINKKRKERAKLKGREIKGRLVEYKE